MSPWAASFCISSVHLGLTKAQLTAHPEPLEATDPCWLSKVSVRRAVRWPASAVHEVTAMFTSE